VSLNVQGFNILLNLKNTMKKEFLKTGKILTKKEQKSILGGQCGLVFDETQCEEYWALPPEYQACSDVHADCVS
jgi:hypothetical protein